MNPREAAAQLRQEVLAVLSGANCPLSTADVARAVGVSPVGTEAYRALLWLERYGQAVSTPRPHTGTRTLYWIPTQRTGEEQDRAQQD